MRITSFTDYSLRTLMYLANLPADQLSSIKEVSAFYNISQNHMSKVIAQLAKCGYIHTIKGKGGGISLAISPDKIRIGRVIQQLENKLDGVDCLSSNCPLRPGCKLKIALIKAVESYIATLNEYTLADFTENNEDISYLLQLDPT